MMALEIKMHVSTPEDRCAQFDRIHEKSKAIVEIMCDSNRGDQDAILKIVKSLIEADRRVCEEKTMSETMKNPMGILSSMCGTAYQGDGVKQRTAPDWVEREIE